MAMIRSSYPGSAYMGPQASAVYDLEKLEDKVVNADLATKDDRATLLEMKEDGYVRKKDVARSWSETSWHFDPMAMRGGAQWLRVVTQPSVIGDGGVAFGRRLIELHLGDCVRGDLTELGPLLCRLSCLELLYLCDNPSLRGDMSKILGSRLPRLRRLALQRTAVETKLGLQTLLPCRRLQYVDVSGCKGVMGSIPEGLQRLAGLHLALAGSRIESEDKYGNRYRSRKADAHPAKPMPRNAGMPPPLPPPELPAPGWKPPPPLQRNKHRGARPMRFANGWVG